MAREIRSKRIYAGVASDDGMRILVERLWPRGIRKSDAAIDLWLKEIAPSAGLRKWLAHDTSRWEASRRCYRGELDANPKPVAELLRLAREQDLTLVYAARDELGNSAHVLGEYPNIRWARD